MNVELPETGAEAPAASVISLTAGEELREESRKSSEAMEAEMTNTASESPWTEAPVSGTGRGQQQQSHKISTQKEAKEGLRDKDSKDRAAPVWQVRPNPKGMLGTLQGVPGTERFDIGHLAMENCRQLNKALGHWKEVMLVLRKSREELKGLDLGEDTSPFYY